MKKIDDFINQWCGKKAMVPVAIDAITACEEKMKLSLPKSYQYLISTYGLLHTPNVMSKTCTIGSRIGQTQDFLSLEDMSALTELYQMSGMPKGHVLFASDCQGNMFCFKRADCLVETRDCPVWFYDNNTREVTQVAESLSEWLNQLNAD